jgi:uncharacterized protein
MFEAMNECEIVEGLLNMVKITQDKEFSGHDFQHTIRVYNNALLIAKQEIDVDIFLLQVSALLHDIADHKFGHTDKDRENIINNILNTFDLENTFIEKVNSIVKGISFSKNTPNIDNCIEIKILQDADRLDAIGAIGISRTFAFGGKFDRPIFTEDIQDRTDSITHFYEKLLKLYDRMNTEVGKQIALKRHKFMNAFLMQFYTEWYGDEEGLINLKKTLDIFSTNIDNTNKQLS